MPQLARIDTAVVDYEIVGDFKFFTPGPARRATVLIKVTDMAGHVGWGQAVPSRTWSYETIESVKSTIDGYLAPALIRADSDDPAHLLQLLDREIAGSFSRGQPICKAGLDLALFDLHLKCRGQTAAQFWRRSSLHSIQLSWTIDVRELAELEAQLRAAEQRGFRNFNLKVGANPALDLEVCRQIRHRFPVAFLWVDANGGYDLDTALEVAPQFAAQGVAAFEQPVPANRLSWFRRLREQGALPILMDEGLVTAVELAEFHRLGLLDGVAMKVARCGGLWESQRIMDYVEQEGLLFFASGLTDPDLSLAASLLLYGAYGLSRPAALNAPQFLTGSILTQPIEVEGDRAYLPRGCGLGVTVNDQLLSSTRFTSHVATH